MFFQKFRVFQKILRFSKSRLFENPDFFQNYDFYNLNINTQSKYFLENNVKFNNLHRIVRLAMLSHR